MEKTVSVNLGTGFFVLEQSAYNLLNGYLKDVSSRLDVAILTRVMADTESRFAYEFMSKDLINGKVVSLVDVQQAITVIGLAETFGSVKNTPLKKPQKLYRNKDNALIGGVCSGLAIYLNVDATIVRIVALVAILFVGIGLPVYLIMWILVPSKAVSE